jgi:hypothetical protein
VSGMTDAQKSQRKRIARRIVLAIAVPVLLVSGYVECFRFFWWCEGHGTTTPHTHVVGLLLFAPLHSYSAQKVLPGAEWLRSQMVEQEKEGRAAARKEIEERRRVRTASD